MHLTQSPIPASSKWKSNTHCVNVTAALSPIPMNPSNALGLNKQRVIQTNAQTTTSSCSPH
jgi:hypothetical protein